MKILLFIFALVCTCLSDEIGSDRARILAAKKIHNLLLVEGRDVVIQYYLHNIGLSAAVNVKLTDNGFGLEDFEIVSGQLEVKFDRIPPGANVSHIVVVRPKKYGYFNFTAADLSYQPSEDSPMIQTAFTSEPGQGGIHNQIDYDRKFSPHVLDWFVFLVLLVPTLLIPFKMWYNIKCKYELSGKSKSLKKN